MYNITSGLSQYNQQSKAALILPVMKWATAEYTAARTPSLRGFAAAVKQPLLFFVIVMLWLWFSLFNHTHCFHVSPCDLFLILSIHYKRISRKKQLRQKLKASTSACCQGKYIAIHYPQRLIKLLKVVNLDYYSCRTSLSSPVGK